MFELYIVPARYDFLFVVLLHMSQIPFHIISGFLGSGKTTLLKRIIEQNASVQKIGIVQNEFAPANLDGVELRKSGKNFELLEINNGSVFCGCLFGDFTRLLEEFIKEHQPDVLVIEASGLSDTTSMSEVLSAGTLSEKIFLASNWCIIDAQNFGKLGLMKQRVCHQLRMADVVVLNKIDLCNSDIKHIEEEIRTINPFAQIKQSVFCDIDLALGEIALSKIYSADVKTLSRPNINSMLIKTSRKTRLDSLLRFLKEWASKAYRIKGYVNIKEGGTVAVQCTFDSVEIKDVEERFQPTELIALTDQFTLREWNKAFRGS